MKQKIPTGYKFIGVENDEIIFEKEKIVPKIMDTYWFIDSYNENVPSSWSDNYIDKQRLSNHNVYLTEEACNKQIAKNNALNKIKTYILDNFGEWEPDWSDTEQQKWYIYYDYLNKRFYAIGTWFGKSICLIPYLKSLEQASQLIKDCEKELKTLFEF